MKQFMLIIITWCLGVASCLAQDSSILNLSLDSCKAMALRQNVSVKIAQHTIDKASAEKNAVLSAYFPKISATGATTYMFDNISVLNSIDPLLPSFNINTNLPAAVQEPINNAINQVRQGIIDGWRPIDISLKGAFIAGITLQQPIFAGGRIVTGNKMAKLGKQMAVDNLKLKEEETLIEAEKSYWLYISVQEKVKLAERYAELLQEVEQQVTAASELNMIDPNALSQVKVKESEVKMQLQKARSGLELSRMALCQLIGLPFTTPVILTDTNVIVEASPLIPTESNVTSRQEYKLLESMVRMKANQVNLTRGEYLPTIGLGACLAYMGNINIAGQVDPPYNISNIMATVNIPITHWWEGSQKIKSARIDKVIAELEFQNNRELMELQAQQIIFNLNDNYQQILIAEEALKTAQENLTTNRNKYELQLQTLPALLEAQGTWQQAYSDLIDARIAYRIALAEYQKVSGQIK